MTPRESIFSLLSRWGGSDAAMLGIALEGRRSEEIYKWFFAAMLYGARISQTLATRTWKAFSERGIVTPQQVLATGWEGLVAVLDAGGYTRYDYKTASKLLEVNRALMEDYGGDLNVLHDAASTPADLEKRIMALGKGIGPTTTSIFLRELRGLWAKANPPLSPLAIDAACRLDILPASVNDQEALAYLQRQWRDAGMAGKRFCEFESALVRAGLYLRHHKTMPQASRRQT